jgi:hypothetical protein
LFLSRFSGPVPGGVGGTLMLLAFPGPAVDVIDDFDFDNDSESDGEVIENETSEERHQ